MTFKDYTMVADDKAKLEETQSKNAAKKLAKDTAKAAKVNKTQSYLWIFLISLIFSISRKLNTKHLLAKQLRPLKKQVVKIIQLESTDHLV